MAIVVDTCSLVMIAKNYLPLDKDGQLYSFLEEAFSRKDLMLLDVILDESKRTSKGIAVEKMPFLKDKKIGHSDKGSISMCPREIQQHDRQQFLCKTEEAGTD